MLKKTLSIILLIVTSFSSLQATFSQTVNIENTENIENAVKNKNLVKTRKILTKIKNNLSPKEFKRFINARRYTSDIDNEVVSILFIAIDTDDLEIVTMLVEDFGADIN